MSEVDFHDVIASHPVIRELRENDRLQDERLADHDEEISRHSIILEQLKTNIIESRASLTRIEGKIDGTVKDAMNSIPAWLGVMLTLLALLVACIQFGHDLWPSH